MIKKIRKSLTAISLIGLSTAAYSGVVFHTLPGETENFPRQEVANDGTILFFNKNENKMQTWNKETNYPSINLNISKAGLGDNHLSYDGKYIIGKDLSSSAYNYYTPTGLIQRGPGGTQGSGIHKMSSNGKRLFSLSKTTTSLTLYFFEHGGLNEVLYPTSKNDYRVVLPLSLDKVTSLGTIKASDFTGDRIVLKHGTTSYFVDITGSSNLRNANLTEIPVNFLQTLSISDDGRSVLGTVSNLSPGCNRSNVVYHETKGLTEISCADGFNVAGSYDFQAISLSGDGTKVIGYNQTTSYIWDETNGVRDLKNILTQNGVNVGNWPTLRVSDISEDGLKITGWATNTNGKGKAFLMEVIPECNVGF
jgi:hypothetical protein